MNSTPRGNREHIVFYGRRNVGKSSLMNKIAKQEVSLVSDYKGTTTDPVSKSMELTGYGPVLFIDTGGLDDIGKIGKLRIQKTNKTLEKADLAIYVLDEFNLEDEIYIEKINEFKNRNIRYLTVVNKTDLNFENIQKKIKQEKNINIKKEEELYNKKELYDDIIFTNINNNHSIEILKKEIIKSLDKYKEETTLIGDLVPYNGKVLMVIDNDSAAPKGRLILPQVQVIRDALDNGIKTYIVRESEFESSLKDLNDINLVITDSKLFKNISKLLPRNIKLTSFSIIMAREKGDLNTFIDGINRINELKNIKKPKVLIAEACTHTVTHEDIGQVKIPRLLEKYLQKELEIVFMSGEDFNIENIDYVIHCGSCMLNKRIMNSRIEKCNKRNIPITNYGVFISYMLGILDRSIEIFK